MIPYIETLDSMYGMFAQMPSGGVQTLSSSTCEFLSTECMDHTIYTYPFFMDGLSYLTRYGCSGYFPFLV